MKNRMAILTLFIPAILTFILICGCGHSPASRFYLIRSDAPVTIGKTAPDAPVIGILPIEVADYLNRPQIVLRTGEHEIAYAQFDRWAEPLESQASTFITDSLSEKLKTMKVRSFPWRESASPLMEVSISILNLEGTVDESVYLRANWRVTKNNGNKVTLVEKRSDLKLKTEKPGILGIVTTTEALFEQLSHEIADAVIKQSAIN